MAKRTFDLIFAVCALLVTWPVIVIAAVAVRLTSPGPAFYRATRAGLNGRAFDMFKLRTMRLGCDPVERRITEPADDRITAVGEWLRTFSIDELPQFWNVLRGDMSVVGPRPEDWGIVHDYYTWEQRRVLSVRPGIVSPADVRWYPDLTFHDPPPPDVPLQEHYLRRHLPAKLAEELRYVARSSLLLDMIVICQTLLCIAGRAWITPKRRPVVVDEDADGRLMTEQGARVE
jgi:lipopolysaccharide/colanic/teichoic acid biosynthesis glycosyltransferase